MNDVSGGDNPADDFDLFWGMGPSHDDRTGNSSSNTHDNSTSTSSSRQQRDNIRDITSGMGVGSSTGGIPSSVHSLSTSLMGGLWSHGGNLEAYGHRHHVHAQADGLSDAGGGLASPQSSHRPEWLPAPSPGIGGAHSGSTMQMQCQRQPAVGNEIHLRPATGVAAASGTGGDIVDSKLDELAAAISSCVIGKLDLGVAGARLLQHGAPSSSSSPSTLPGPPDDVSFKRRTAEAVAPLRSRVLALEDQVADLKAALERNTAAVAATSAAARHPPPPRPGEGFIQQRYQHQQQQQPQQPQGKIPLLPEYMVGENDATLPSLRGQQAGRGGRSGAAAAAAGGGGGVAALEQSIAALAQRTGTLEGRHKQVQAKVSLLDNAFGSKASDWAQTVKHILVEREAASAGVAGKAGVRAGPKGGKKTTAGVASLQPVPSGSGSNNVRGAAGGGSGSRGGNGTAHQPRDSGHGGPAETHVMAGSTEGGNGNKHEVAGGLINSATHISGQSTSTSTPKSLPQGADSSCTTPEVVQASHASQACATSVSGRCPAYMETEERCMRLEARVLESERSLALVQSKATAATAAAAAAEAHATRALETAVVAANTESKREADALEGRQKGLGGNWAPKASLEKLASDLKQLSDKSKEGEDALALVDHGLRGVRDEIGSFSGSLSSLKRLVESHLREKEQAAEMLKGYVTTITREVATITRQYINNLVAPGRLTTGSGGLMEPSNSPGEAPPAMAAPATAPQIDVPPGAGIDGAGSGTAASELSR